MLPRKQRRRSVGNSKPPEVKQTEARKHCRVRRTDRPLRMHEGNLLTSTGVPVLCVEEKSLPAPGVKRLRELVFHPNLRQTMKLTQIRNLPIDASALYADAG